MLPQEYLAVMLQSLVDIGNVTVGELEDSLRAVISAEQRFNCLKSVKSVFECTTLHFAAENGLIEILECIALYIQPGHLFELMKAKAMLGKTPLHHAVENKDEGLVRRMLQFFTQEQCLWLLCINEDFGWHDTPLHCAVLKKDSVMVDLMLGVISTASTFSLVSCPTSFGNTILHYAAGRGYSPDIMERVLGQLSDEERVKMLAMTNEFGNTAIHWAADLGNTPAIRSIAKFIPMRKMKQLLKIENGFFSTALHDARCSQRDDTVEYLRQLLESEDEKPEPTQRDELIEELPIEHQDGVQEQEMGDEEETLEGAAAYEEVVEEEEEGQYLVEMVVGEIEEEAAEGQDGEGEQRLEPQQLTGRKEQGGHTIHQCNTSDTEALMSTKIEDLEQQIVALKKTDAGKDKEIAEMKKRMEILEELRTTPKIVEKAHDGGKLREITTSAIEETGIG